MVVSTLEQIIRRQHARHIGDVVLWTFAALHVLMAASLLIVLLFVAPAHAVEDACGGRNLLSELRQSDSEAYQTIEAEAAKVPNGKGLFWKIEKPGVEPSWLLGTMHVTDPRVLAMPPAARKAAAEASVVVIESDEILDEKKATAAILVNPELSMFTDGTTIADHLDASETRTLDDGLRSRGLSLAAVSRMKPWILAGFVALPACELSRKAAGASFLDKQIAEDAAKAGKTVKGLETLAEQLTALSALPIEFHFDALIETLALGDKMQDVMATMTDLYLSGDIGMTMPMLKAVTGEDSENDRAYAAFEQRIVTDRNRVMAERGAAIIEAGNAFIAVGALHLPGEEGLVELLRQRGYSVARVDG